MNLSRKKTFKHILIVVLSNMASLVSGIFIGFIVPRIMSLDAYGYYKTYSLYMHYATFLSLGIVDGIVLKNGAKNYDELDRELFRGLFATYLYIQLFFVFVITLIALFISHPDYKIVILFVGVNVIATNITGYFTQISQITMRFGELSTRTFIRSILNCVVAIILFFLFIKGIYEVDHVGYLIACTVVSFILMFWYINTYRDIVFGKKQKISTSIKETIGFAKTGLPLLFANTCSNFILVIDRQFVNATFDNTTYAKYSFAYTLLSLVTVVTSAISTVLFPTLKRSDKIGLKEKYISLVVIMLTVVFACLIGFYPVALLVKWILPKYIESIPIFRIVFPALAISTPITVIIHNYYKTHDREKQFFIQSVIILILSLICNCIAYFIFGTTESISWASLLTVFIWFVVSNHGITKHMGVSNWYLYIYIIVLTVLYFVFTSLKNQGLGICLYAVVFIVISLVFNYKEYKKIIRIMKK